MPKIVIEKFTRWLFAENLDEKSIFEFVEYKTDFKSKKGTDMPVFVLLGNDKDNSGEFLLSTWNIENLEEIMTKLGDNTDTWGTPKFKATAVGKSIKLDILPT